jgi:hypothetical protein
MEHRRIPLPRPDRLAVLPPDMIGQAIDRLIEALDQRQGDIDLEDSEAGQTDIDERGHRLGDHRLGFLEGLGPTDDPDRELNGDEKDAGVVAFHRADPLYRLAEHRDADIALAGLEDDEDDDPGGGNITDDPHDDVDEDAHDRTYPEWHTLRAVDRRSGGIEGKVIDPPGSWRPRPDEDDEDDDPQGEGNRMAEGDEGEPDFRRRAKREGGPDCMISDQDYGGEEQGEGDPAELLGHP